MSAHADPTECAAWQLESFETVVNGAISIRHPLKVLCMLPVRNYHWVDHERPSPVYHKIFVFNQTQVFILKASFYDSYYRRSQNITLHNDK